MEIKENVSLKPFNTFGVEANAAYYTSVHSAADVHAILNDSFLRSLPLLILGGGSNVLFTQNWDGLVVHNMIKGIGVSNEEDKYTTLSVGSGEVWHDVVLFSIANDLGGIENLSLIPGTAGAAPIQNIGAYGVEISQSLESVEAIEIATNQKTSFSNRECELGYRDSYFKQQGRGRFFITEIILRLQKNPVFNTSYGAIQEVLNANGIKEPSIEDISNTIIQIRQSKLPDPANLGNAGSFFKNPVIDLAFFKTLEAQFADIPFYVVNPGKIKIPAGWLIEQCGWKGKRKGQAGVHQKQALVLVNHGNASGTEIAALANQIKQSVKEKFGISLQMEVNIL